MGETTVTTPPAEILTVPVAERKKGEHCWDPDNEANQAPIYLCTETGEVRRWKVVTDPRNISFMERCHLCGERRRRMFVLENDPEHQGQQRTVETTPAPTTCKA